MFDEYGIPHFRENSKEAVIARSLVMIISISYLLQILSYFVERLKEVVNVTKDINISVEFIEKYLIRRFQRLLPIATDEIILKWEKMSMKIDKLQFYLIDTKLNSLWSLLMRLGDGRSKILEILGGNIMKNNYDNGVTVLLNDENEEHKCKDEIIYAEKHEIVSFCLNSTNSDQLAFGTSNSVKEISIEASLKFFNVNSLTYSSITEFEAVKWVLKMNLTQKISMDLRQ